MIDLSAPYLQRAVLEMLLLAVPAGLLGSWIVLRRLAFFTHAVGTVSFPALVLASAWSIAPQLAALVAALGFGVAQERLVRTRRLAADAATGLLLVGALAAGVVLASDVFESGAEVDTLLFGSLIGLTERDVWLTALAAAGAVAARRRAAPPLAGRRLRARQRAGARGPAGAGGPAAAGGRGGVRGRRARRRRRAARDRRARGSGRDGPPAHRPPRDAPARSDRAGRRRGGRGGLAGGRAQRRGRPGARRARRRRVRGGRDGDGRCAGGRWRHDGTGLGDPVQRRHRRPRAFGRLPAGTRRPARGRLHRRPGRDRRRARPQRRRQDDAVPRAAGRAARPARRDRDAGPARVRAPDRARAARLPGQRVRRRADGRLRADAVVPARRAPRPRGRARGAGPGRAGGACERHVRRALRAASASAS